MQVKISPSDISGLVMAPASKSAMQRVCALALLKDGETIISNPGQSNDDKAALSIIKNLGARIELLADYSLKITGNQLLGNTKNDTAQEEALSFSCGESGLSIRMFTPGKCSALTCSPRGSYLIAAVEEKISLWQARKL